MLSFNTLALLTRHTSAIATAYYSQDYNISVKIFFLTVSSIMCATIIELSMCKLQKLDECGG